MSRARTTIHRFRHTYRSSSPSIPSSSSATSLFQSHPRSSLLSFLSHPKHSPIIPNPFHFHIHSSYFSSSAPKQDFLGSDNDYPTGDFHFEHATGWKKFIVKLRMLIALPWERIQHGSVLKIKLRGQISDQLKRKKSTFSKVLSLPEICDNLVKAAYDPRISGVYLHIDILNCGWAKVEEIRRHILNFRKSGKFVVAYVPSCREKEYYIACACEEIYAPPSAYFSLFGLTVQASFVRGKLTCFSLHLFKKSLTINDGLYQVVSEHSILSAQNDTQKKTEFRTEDPQHCVPEWKERFEKIERHWKKRRKPEEKRCGTRRHHAPTRRSGRRDKILKKIEETLVNLRLSISDLREELEGAKESGETGRETDEFERDQNGGKKETRSEEQLEEATMEEQRKRGSPEETTPAESSPEALSENDAATMEMMRTVGDEEMFLSPWSERLETTKEESAEGFPRKSDLDPVVISLGQAQFKVSNSELFQIGRGVLTVMTEKEKKLVGIGWSQKKVDLNFNPMGQTHNFTITPPIFTNKRRVLQVEKEVDLSFNPMGKAHNFIITPPIFTNSWGKLQVEKEMDKKKFVGNDLAQKKMGLAFNSNGPVHTPITTSIRSIKRCRVDGSSTNISSMVNSSLVFKWDPGGLTRDGWNPSGTKRDEDISAHTSARECQGIRTHQYYQVPFLNLQPIISLVSYHGGASMGFEKGKTTYAIKRFEDISTVTMTRAFDVVAEMEAELHLIEPDHISTGIITISPLMKARARAAQTCSKTRTWQKALELYKYLKSLKLVQTASIVNALLMALCDGDQFQNALEVLSEMKELGLCPNNITFSILIVASEEENDMEAAPMFLSDPVLITLINSLDYHGNPTFQHHQLILEFQPEAVLTSYCSGDSMSSKMFKSPIIEAAQLNNEERWWQETRGIEIKKHLPCTLEVGLFLKILRDQGSYFDCCLQNVETVSCSARLGWYNMPIDEHLIQRTGYSTMSVEETRQKQWDLGEIFSDSCIIETSCFKLWDPGGLCLLFTNHLEDKVNFKGGGVDTNKVKQGRIGNNPKIYERKKWKPITWGPLAHKHTPQSDVTNSAYVAVSGGNEKEYSECEV